MGCTAEALAPSHPDSRIDAAGEGQSSDSCTWSTSLLHSEGMSGKMLYILLSEGGNGIHEECRGGLARACKEAPQFGCHYGLLALMCAGEWQSACGIMLVLQQC
jgi:hypothetical protein